MRPPRPCRTTTIRLRPGPGCSAARPIVSRTAASVLVPSVLSPRLKTLMPGGFTPPVQIKSRLEGSRRGLPHRDQTRRPPSRRWRTGVWGPRPGPAERAGWGGGGARERMRDGRQAVPKRADFAATRPCRTTTIKLRPGPGCSAARPIVSRTAASVLVPSVLSPRLKTLMPGGFTPPVQIKSRLEGSRRGLPHRDQTRRPPSRRWRTGVWGPRPGPAERAGWGGGGARERMRDGRQAVPKRADFAATRPRRTTTIRLRPGPGC